MIKTAVTKYILFLLVLASIGLFFVSCTPTSDDNTTGSGNSELPGETSGDIFISVIDNFGTPSYSWSDSNVVDLYVVRTSDTTSMVWGIQPNIASNIASPVTHGTVPNGCLNYVNGYPEEELALSAGIEYRVEVTSSNGTWGRKVFNPTGESGGNNSDSLGIIHGFVVDDVTDAGIVNANIISDDNKTTTSGGDGWYEIKVLPGIRLLTVNADGYQTNIEDITVTSSDTTFQFFDMTVGTGGESFGAISGKVIDSETQLALENVMLFDESYSTIYTNDYGEYFDTWESGSHTFTASQTGYESFEFTATIITGQIYTKNFSMMADTGNASLEYLSITTYDTSYNLVPSVYISSDDGVYGTTNEMGELALYVNTGTRTITASKDGYETSIRTVDIEGSSNSLSFFLTPTGGGTGTIAGNVRNSQYGDALVGVTIVSDDGASTSTNGNGDYTITVDSGTRTLTASYSDYYSNARTITVSDDEVVDDFNFTLTPNLGGAAGLMNIELHWGATPEDLDSHLETPLIEGYEYHVYWGDEGETNAAPYAMLNLDDTDGEGPETITIYQFFAGTYKYYVNNYSESPELTQSNAYVQIWTDQGLVNTINVPTTGTGYWWYVCDIDGSTKEVTIVNQIMEDISRSTFSMPSKSKD